MINQNGNQELNWSKTARVQAFIIYESPIIVLDDCRLSRSEIGAYTTISRRTELAFSQIGRYCSIGPNCLIAPSNHPFDRITSSIVTYDNQFDFFLSNRKFKEEFHDHHVPVIIGSDVFMGANVVVKDGIRIGDGAIIGAGAVVTSDVLPMTIVGGVPARKIRSRFAEDIAARVLNLRWWRFDLLAWQATGQLPPMRMVDHALLDAMEASIEAGTAPLIEGRRRRMTFGAGAPVLDHLPD